jgi:hypothetical protein
MTTPARSSGVLVETIERDAEHSHLVERPRGLLVSKSLSSLNSSRTSRESSRWCGTDGGSSMTSGC